MPVEGQLILHQGGTDQLVEGIMPAHIFPQQQGRPWLLKSAEACNPPVALKVSCTP